ncbi:alpha/beta hydrolase family protein [Dactylosporangium roseum]|uniref:alpha/beta hydrolase family protein n=1 Tax=Dactylosporangium roseum TaxID=47989 RepID=UPI0021B25E31|nr:alpha/beta fold hydrolase [Dactylosporangium roseum]
MGNDFAIRTETVTIPAASGELDGVLAWPDVTARPVGVVVFVHGDGPIDATSGGFYLPIWESLAQAGYASLSWSKPGVGGSTGNWLAQSMADRAREVEAAIDWVAARPGIDPARIGLWGASQAGWVAPAVAAGREDVTFVIMVSPAINWLRQGRYNLLAELEAAHASNEERERAVAVGDDRRRLLAENASYQRYRAETIDPKPMSEDRWAFARTNYRADATADLQALRHRGIPVLLLLGEEDRNVDIDETEAAYRTTLGPSLTVRRFPNARHSLVRTAVEDHDWWGVTVAVLTPRRLFVPGCLNAHRNFADRQ